VPSRPSLLWRTHPALAHPALPSSARPASARPALAAGPQTQTLDPPTRSGLLLLLYCVCDVALRPPTLAAGIRSCFHAQERPLGAIGSDRRLTRQRGVVCCCACRAACWSSRGQSCESAGGRSCESAGGRSCESAGGKSCESAGGKSCESAGGKSCESARGQSARGECCGTARHEKSQNGIAGGEMNRAPSARAP